MHLCWGEVCGGGDLSSVVGVGGRGEGDVVALAMEWEWWWWCGQIGKNRAIFCFLGTWRRREGQGMP